MRCHFHLDSLSASSRCLAINFNQTRSRIDHVTSEQGTVSQLSPWVVVLEVAEQLVDAETEIVLEIEYRGEPISLGSRVELEERLEDEQVLRLFHRDSTSQCGLPAATADARKIEETMLAFFDDFDGKTTPNDEDEELFFNAQNLLIERLRVRRERFVDGGLAPEPAELPQLPESVTQELSKLQIGVMAAHYQGPGGELNIAALGNAFRMFAAGRLGSCEPSKRGWRGRPDSAYVCLFAEFATQAMDQDVSAEVWRGLLPSLVAMEHIFHSSSSDRDRPCIPTGPKRSFSDYGPAGTLTDEEIENALAGWTIRASEGVDPVLEHGRALMRLFLDFDVAPAVLPEAWSVEN